MNAMKAMKAKTNVAKAPKKAKTQKKKKEKAATAPKNAKKNCGKAKKCKVSFKDLIVWDAEARLKTRGAFTSKAYDQTKGRCKREGFEDEIACKRAKEAYAAAAEVYAAHRR